MSRPLIRALVAAVAACSPLLPAQSPAGDALLAPPAVLRAFDVAAATLQTLQVPQVRPAYATIGVVFAGTPRTMELWPFDVRSPNFQLWERNPDGMSPRPAPPCNTLRGHLHGEPGSVVAASLHGGSLTAFVRRASGELWVVQPVRDVVPSAAPALHVVFRSADSAPRAVNCGAVAAAVPTPVAVGNSGDAVWVCELALEADHALFVLNGGNVAATQNDVLAVVNAMDVIFTNDVEVHLQVSQLIVDSTPDPYTTSVAAPLLSEFRNHWNTYHGTLQRDVAHLFSGRTIGAASAGTIGYAYIGTACDLPNGYSLSQTRWSPNFAYRVAVTAHELGHNFNATHCDGQPACSLMCSSIGGCAANPNAFSLPEQGQIVAFRQNATCLAMLPTVPHITSASPAQIETVNPATVTLGGTGMLGTTSVTVGGQVVTTGLQVLSDTQLRFVPPMGLSLGFHLVTVTNPAGTSNATVLWYRPSDPCQLLVADSVAGGSLLTWTLGGWPQDIGYLGISFVNTTTPFLGERLLDNFTVLWLGVLDARGMAWCTVPIPAGLLSSCTVYSQMLDAMPTAATLRSVSAVQATWIY